MARGRIFGGGVEADVMAGRGRLLETSIGIRTKEVALMRSVSEGVVSAHGDKMIFNYFFDFWVTHSFQSNIHIAQFG